VTIASLRILPPLAIGRLGEGAPMDSYRIEVDDERPLDWRRIVPDTTFVVDESTGAITSSSVPDEIEFSHLRDGRVLVHKVAPFLELWADTGEPELVPVTLALLAEHQLSPADIRWDVAVANRKVERRTGNPDDAVLASAAAITDHEAHELSGTCANFVADASIPFGSVRYVKPTDAFPEIRFRFTPADGRIYGSAEITGDSVAEWEDEHLAGRPYRPAVVEPPYESWYRWQIPVDDGVEQPGSGQAFKNETFPPSLFAIEPPAPPWLNDNRAVSRGYFDDACDGIVDVHIDALGLSASARISAGPPALVPDALFVRSLADDLEQAVAGPAVDTTEPAEVTRARAEEIVRRAFETVRFMNVAVMNGEPVQGRPPLSLDTMPAEEAFDTDRLMRPVMEAGTVDTLSVMALHQQVYAALRGGAAPWFVRLLRRPEASGDFTDDGRRRMPALMCGADGNYLALTHRQIATIEKVATDPARPSDDRSDPTPESEPSAGAALTPVNRTAQIHYLSAGTPFNASPAAAIGNCCPGLELDFRAVWRRILTGVTLREYDNLVTEGVVTDVDGVEHDLRGHRLLAIGGKATMATMVGPSPADAAAGVLLSTEENPSATFTPEWSNQLAHLLAGSQGTDVECVFTHGPVWEELVPWHPGYHGRTIRATLTVRHFFDGDTAFISRELAQPGELTQGLCSPWQNDFRECSCYYWASARPDFVNVETTQDGRSVGDNWLQKERTGTYVPDDYVDDRLVLYDDLMGDWQRWSRFQVRGRDATSSGQAPDPGADP
jgi:hypothetical protein